MSRLEQLPNGHWAERYDNIPDRCAGCSGILARPNISLSTMHCPTHGRQRSIRCTACRTEHTDCECRTATAAPTIGGSAYSAPPGQWGPTADFGDG